MTKTDFILQYVAARIANAATNNTLNFHKEPMSNSAKGAIKEAQWLWEALPDELKLETNNQKS